MCGITGFFGFGNGKKLVGSALSIMSYRGLDASNNISVNGCCMGHCLHAINREVAQPLHKDNFLFVANCEVYNWKELDSMNSVSSRNDAEALFNYLRLSGDLLNAMEEIDGDYSFALYNKEKKLLFLARDLIGVKPLWYYYHPVSREFAFASEKKALKQHGLEEAYTYELNPRKLLLFDAANKALKEYERDFFEPKKNDGPEEEIIENTNNLLLKAIKKRVPGKKIGLLFSGGIDSVFLAYNLKKLGTSFTCYVAALREPGLKDSEDVSWAKKAAGLLGLKLEVIEMGLEEVPGLLKEILPLIEDNNVVKAGVALPFYVAARKAREQGVKILFSGLGSEEIFAGYERHKKSFDVNKECLSGLRKIYERDLYRDDVITMKNNIELRVPFLDKDLVRYALSIPGHMKISGDGQTKMILRKIAEKQGIHKELAQRKKKAAQYGSNFDKAISKLAGKEKKSKSEYLKRFYGSGNARLAALISTGKDSLLATQIMIDQNYCVECFITINTENKDSYMYHGPNTHLAELQAQAAGKPLIVQETKGEKELELEDLKKAIKKAMKKHKIEGIITGALYSSYQRERIEKTCEELGIKCFSPLWHIDQEKELELLLRKGFEFTIVKIAAEGLTKEWLGKTITRKEIEKLKTLNKKNGFNIAGEGGEYESLVLKAPFFNKKIKIEKTRLIEENKHSATLIIEKAVLE